MIAHILKALISVQTASDGDWVDRLNHRFTAMILVILGILVSTKQYVGDPINCWTPAHFNREWVEYTNNICWISNTYYLPFETLIESARRQNIQRRIKYYQWVPIILALQGLCFYIPRTVWRAFCMSAGIDIDKIVNTATTFESVLNPDLWDKTVRYLARHYDRYLDAQRDPGVGLLAKVRILFSRMLCVFSRRYGNYLNVFYLGTKILYLLNVYGQLFILGEWLGDGYYYYGFEVANQILEGKDWTRDGRFARVTLCDFKIRTVGNVQQYTVQCVLSINLFNEKIYLFVWFWLMFIAIVTSINFLEWIVRSVCFLDRLSYIKKHLKFTERYNTEEDKRLCRRFVNVYLRPDGVFMIRLLSKNTNSIIVSELVAALWDNYKKKHIGIRSTLTTAGNNIHPSAANSTDLQQSMLNPHPHSHPNYALMNGGCPYNTGGAGSLHSRASAGIYVGEHKLPTTLPFSKSKIQQMFTQQNNPNTCQPSNMYAAAPTYALAASNGGAMTGMQARKQIEALSNASNNDILDV